MTAVVMGDYLGLVTEGTAPTSVHICRTFCQAVPKPSHLLLGFDLPSEFHIVSAHLTETIFVLRQLVLYQENDSIAEEAQNRFTGSWQGCSGPTVGGGGEGTQGQRDALTRGHLEKTGVLSRFPKGLPKLQELFRDPFPSH